jgi:Dyp-type peroxidase family
MTEPLLDADDIQGHVLPGYGPGHICLLAVAADSGDAARAFLRALQPHITTMRTALAERAERKAFRKGMGERPVDRLHVHVAFTRRGLDQLGHEQRGVDRAFDAGMTGLSTGDCKCAVRPDGVREPAHPSNWLVGGQGSGFDILAMFIARERLDAALSSLRAQLAAIPGLRAVYEEQGADLPERREHFGFRDGISGPGLYGEYEDRGARIPVTTRYGVPPHCGREFGRPGQPLVWPGRFLVGLPRSRGETPSLPDPIWRNGSFLVFRRLEQDVAAFHADTDAMAAELAPAVPGITGETVRTLIVGRRRNGQPLMRAGDEPESALAINHFQYQTVAPAITLTDGTEIPAARRDVQGAICPFWSHIRKVNPRDGINDLATDAADLQLLRRGVPFGPAYDHDDPGAPTNQRSRGLLFLAYQSDIHEHFENLSSHWMNQFDQPAGGGHDLLVGLALDAPGHLGPRRADWPGSATQLVARRHWVIPTGGAYLFAPSLAAINLLVSRRDR